MNVEQAIFTSARTARLAGYQLVARSPGVSDADARELSTWGPSHDSLLESGSAAVSVNFHPLPSGAFCVSQTTPAGCEYSGRGGSQVYTQALVVPAEVLTQFANNPFAVLRAALAQGIVRVYDTPPKHLEPFKLNGQSAAVDEATLAAFIDKSPASSLAALIEAVLVSPALGLVAGALGPRLLAGVINCLPVECRTAFSFSTGLRFSPCRPFKLCCLPDRPAEHRRIERQFQLKVFQFQVGETAQSEVRTGWASFVEEVLKTGRLPQFSRLLSQPRSGLTPADLPDLAVRLAKELLTTGESRSDAGRTAAKAKPMPAAPEPANVYMRVADQGPPTGWQRADASHRKPGHETAVVTVADLITAGFEASEALAECHPDLSPLLDELEDTIFECLAGKTAALEGLEKQWKRLTRSLDEFSVEKVREVYLRQIITVWRELDADEQAIRPDRALWAMQVLSTVLGSAADL